MPTPSTHNIREPDYEVTPLELFFDLMFVFALLQLSHHLMTHLSWRGAAQTLVMLLAVFGVWSYTSWAATLISAQRVRTRWMVLAVTLLSLFMNAAVTSAFTDASWVFIVPFLIIQLGRTVWTFQNASDQSHRDQYSRVLIWLAITTPLWIAGAAATPANRLFWWALAAGIDLFGTLLAHPLPGRRLHSERFPFEGPHMLERCRLFLLIALGETVIRTGQSIAAAPIALMTVVTGASALVATVALWWLAFGRTGHRIVEHVERTHNPARASLYAVNVLIAMVAGLVATAVANEVMIAYPFRHTSSLVSVLLYGGPVLFLLGQGRYLSSVPRQPPHVRLLGAGALLLLAIVLSTAPQFVGLVLVGISLTIIAILDERRQSSYGDSRED